MTSEEQKQFVFKLCTTIARSIVAQIDDGKIPEDWNGIELRWLIAERANDACYGDIAGSFRLRRRRYNNILRINSL